MGCDERYYVLTGRRFTATVKVEDDYIVEAPEPVTILKWKRWSDTEKACARWGWNVQPVEVIDLGCVSLRS